MQRTANENAACLRRICKRSDQPKIERVANNDARLILRRKLRRGNDMIESTLKAKTWSQPWTLIRPCWVSSARCSKVWSNQLWDSLCLSAVSLSQQRHDILDFSYYPLSRVLHVTLASGQGFGFEIYLRSSSSAFSGFVNISRPADYFTINLLHRADESQQGRNSCPRLHAILSILYLPWKQMRESLGSRLLPAFVFLFDAFLFVKQETPRDRLR